MMILVISISVCGRFHNNNDVVARTLGAMGKLVAGDRPDSAKNDPNHPGHSVYLNYTSARR